MFGLFKPTKTKQSKVEIAKHIVDEMLAEEEAMVKVRSMYRVNFELSNGETHIYNQMAFGLEDLEKRVKSYYQQFLKEQFHWVNPWVEYSNGDRDGSFNLNYV